MTSMIHAHDAFVLHAHACNNGVAMIFKNQESANFVQKQNKRSRSMYISIGLERDDVEKCANTETQFL